MALGVLFSATSESNLQSQHLMCFLKPGNSTQMCWSTWCYLGWQNCFEQLLKEYKTKKTNHEVQVMYTYNLQKFFSNGII